MGALGEKSEFPAFFMYPEFQVLKHKVPGRHIPDIIFPRNLCSLHSLKKIVSGNIVYHILFCLDNLILQLCLDYMVCCVHKNKSSL